MTSVVLASLATLAACASNSYVARKTWDDHRPYLVCKDTEVQFCERFSAFKWGHCECVGIDRP